MAVCNFVTHASMALPQLVTRLSMEDQPEAEAALQQACEADGVDYQVWTQGLL